MNSQLETRNWELATCPVLNAFRPLRGIRPCTLHFELCTLWPGAQRLAASQMNSLAKRIGVQAECRACSTPCGISYEFALCLHHTARGETRAQRLSASHMNSHRDSRQRA